MQATRELIKIGYFSKKINTNLGHLINFIEKWRKEKNLNAGSLAEIILDESGYTEMWQNEKSPDAETRLENLKELINAGLSLSAASKYLAKKNGLKKGFIYNLN